MKNILLIIALLGFKIAAADIVVHQSMYGYFYCDITPYLCENCGEDTAKQLAVTIVGDNVVDRAEIYWAIYSDASSNRWNGNLALEGEDYRNYREINTDDDSFAKAKFLYQYIHSQLPLIDPIE